MKINKLSVRNSTMRSIRTADRRPEPTAAALESPAGLTPEDATPPPPPFKDPNVLKEKNETTTTTSLVNGKVEWSTPESPENFHIRLCERFGTSGKACPLPKTSAAAYTSLGEAAGAFLEWLPTSQDFRKTQHGGGVATLVNLFRANQGRKAATGPEEQECPYTLYDGRLHPATWRALTEEEQEKWNRHRPHVPGPWRNTEAAAKPKTGPATDFLRIAREEAGL